jgi:hypothetical protein
MLKLPYFKRKKIGSDGEAKTNEVLKKFVSQKKCMLMTNVVLPLYDGTCEIDHILFGKFGVAVVETKNISGELLGNGKQLVHKNGSRERMMYNPAMQNETHVKNVKYHLTKAGFKNIPIYSFVVFTSDNIKFPKSVGIHISELEKNIKNLPDNKCSAEKLYSAIDKIKVSDLFEKFKHNIKVSMK